MVETVNAQQQSNGNANDEIETNEKCKRGAHNMEDTGATGSIATAMDRQEGKVSPQPHKRAKYHHHLNSYISSSLSSTLSSTFMPVHLQMLKSLYEYHSHSHPHPLDESENERNGNEKKNDPPIAKRRGNESASEGSGNFANERKHEPATTAVPVVITTTTTTLRDGETPVPEPIWTLIERFLLERSMLQDHKHKHDYYNLAYSDATDILRRSRHTLPPTSTTTSTQTPRPMNSSLEHPNPSSHPPPSSNDHDCRSGVVRPFDVFSDPSSVMGSAANHSYNDNETISSHSWSFITNIVGLQRHQVVNQTKAASSPFLPLMKAIQEKIMEIQKLLRSCIEERSRRNRLSIHSLVNRPSMNPFHRPSQMKSLQSRSDSSCNVFEENQIIELNHKLNLWKNLHDNLQLILIA